MQSVEGEAWRSLALRLMKAAWSITDADQRDTLATVIGLGEVDDSPFRSDMRKDYPENPTEDDFAEAFQRHFFEAGSQIKMFGIGPNMPSQWKDPTPVLDVASIARHAGVTPAAVRMAIGRGSLPSMKLYGTLFVRVHDCEAYFKAWDSEKSDRIIAALKASMPSLAVRDGVAYQVDGDLAKGIRSTE